MSYCLQDLHVQLLFSDDVWNHVVQDHENLFYTEPLGSNLPMYRDSSMGMNHMRQESYQSVGSVGSNQSGSSESPRQPFSRQSSMGSDRSSYSQPATTRQYQQTKDRSLLEYHQRQQHSEQFQRDSSVRQSDPSYAAFSKSLNTENGPHKTSQKLRMKIPLTAEPSSSINVAVSQSGKRKSVSMVPDLKNVGNISNSSGVSLCEILFGIKLCHYKQRPPRPNGASVDQVLRDRKVIVQGVVTDSQADICGQINRGKWTD